jgi:iron complex transport system substrate-binding protein
MEIPIRYSIIRYRSCFALAMLLSMSGCRPTKPVATTQPATSAAAAPHRIISIAPNATEIIGELGCADRLVAVSSFCLYPPQVKSLPKVGGLFDVNLEMVLRLQPDLIVLRGAQKPLEDLCATGGIRLYRDHTQSFSDIFRTVEELGDLLDARDAASSVEKKMHARLESIQKAVAGMRTPRVFISLARSPDSIAAVMTAGKGTFIDEMIQMAGGRNIFGDSTLDYPQISPEAVLAAQPDVIIESMPEQKIDDELIRKLRLHWKRLGSMPATRDSKIYALDAENAQIPSPRIVDVVAQIAKLLHPGIVIE